MALTYATYVAAITDLMPTDATTDSGFVTILVDIIDYAEQRIQRDLDLLQTVVRDASAGLTASNRNFTLPNSSGTFVVVNGINAITPAGTMAPDSGTRNQLLPVSRDFLDLTWPSVSSAALPQYFAMMTQTSIVVGPWPDANYQMEVIGTQRFTPLSLANTVTWISTNLPDLFIAASMVFVSGYMKNFGAQADDPKMAQSWETQYQTLLQSAMTEEARKKFAGSAWTSQSVGGNPASPPRT